jgi:hypothetical protein
MLLLLASLCPCSQQPKPIRNTDAEVVEAALLSFYGKTGKLAPDWGEGAYIVARRRFKSDERGDFKFTIGNMIAYAISHKKSKEIATLKAVRNSIRNTGFAPGKISPLEHLSLDARIVLTDSHRDWMTRNQRVVTRTGRSGTARAWASVGVPTYSQDGNFAIVSMHLPWSIHSADVSILLKRAKAGWSVILVQSVFYV